LIDPVKVFLFNRPRPAVGLPGDPKPIDQPNLTACKRSAVHKRIIVLQATIKINMSMAGDRRMVADCDVLRSAAPSLSIEHPNNGRLRRVVFPQHDILAVAAAPRLISNFYES
jgi:hypothetical protein